MRKGFVFGCFLGVFVLTCLQWANGQVFFRIINSIPHLPVVNDAAASVASPAVGSIVYDIANFNVRIYNGTTWISICNETGTVATTTTKFSIKGGIPALAAVDDNLDLGRWTPSKGDAYFSISRGAFLVYNNSTFVKFNGLPGGLEESAGSGVTNDGELFKIPILTNAPTNNVQNGAICFSTDGILQVYYNGYWNNLGCCPSSSITIAHTANEVAPQSKSVTYKLVDYNGICWLAQNLGADKQADSATDNSKEARGWFWQFNHKRGYNHDGGSIRTPPGSWTITEIDQNSNWDDPLKDPCRSELGGAWRLPTNSEWTNADKWIDRTQAYNSVLKLHAAGNLYTSNGKLGNKGINGYYWSSTQDTDNDTYTKAHIFQLTSSEAYPTPYDKANGFTLRCVSP